MIRPLRRTYVVVIRRTGELLCGGYKWVSRFEAQCIRTRWTGESWVDQMSRLHGTACLRQCGSLATKLSRLDACEGTKVVRWCRTQASSHNSQGVVDGKVSKAGVSAAASNRSAVLCCRMDQGQGGYSQRWCSSTPARASKLPQECDAWCQLFAKWRRVSVIRERPVQRYSEVFGFGAEGQGFIPLSPASAIIIARILKVFKAITRQLLLLQSCSNHPRIQQVF